MRRAVLLDKDGTLIEDVPYNVDPALIRLAPGVGEALRALHGAGYTLVVVTNQSGVARGLFPESALEGVEVRLRELLAAEGVPLSGFYACPHHPEGTVAKYTRDCDCRKPQPGLLRRAAKELDLDLAASWMVGDILNDVEAGGRAGCRTVLLDTGGETEWVLGQYRTPDVTARNWSEVAAAILAAEAEQEGRADALRTS
ncbi:D-glycero-alpha-D-manno-heptose-1,7-bisphosphate 7-phosphatase [Deinococcus metallilatus]|uniref:D,D-heptose 1,7-bisphosphate phosphatase n=1 Tax=Deinococcus metallilatus TaxID=1211322 RepID=A0ABR6MMU8_9DEIO|nr:HAD family hydrolase [Deinococcus metallilatus]MBB5293266.1 histidinol-phosphate phosphatase family protein [Deinococcus metallilatus]GMA15511.1 D,D-heptose 1,7-bisphosphate phosphatase [Deinococcus metallilatus]